MDKEKLFQAMKKKGMSKEDVRRELGISRSAFYRKCNGISEFTLSEVLKMIDVLKLESPEQIFFAGKVS